MQGDTRVTCAERNEHVKTQQEGGHWKAKEREALGEIKPAEALNLGVQPPGL